ncbi:hypothetical protein QR680_012622 [Steinernema hermaphroditum]|uniref:Tudor domain-containing protein n=1 Tax=Steinernema hermaphroditum TaxID=289476 RepID=A0AA39I3Y1_9BILA|nr:hypothetical protein QR680_012622 [Steinernema hermaphroditum]
MAGRAFFADKDFTWFLGLPRRKVTTPFEGTITHATSFSSVFVRSVQSEKILADLEEKLEEHLRLNPRSPSHVSRNKLALIRYGPFPRVHRVLVLDTKGKMANVVFVDTGNIAEVPSELLHPLPVEFDSVPAQAIPLRVENTPAEQRILFDDFLRSVVGRRARVELKGGASKGRLKGSLRVLDGSGQLHSLEEIVAWRNTSFWGEVCNSNRFLPVVSPGHGSRVVQAISSVSPGQTSVTFFFHFAYLVVIAAAFGIIVLLWRKMKRTKERVARSLQLIEFENVVQENSL